jgi:adenylate cyclase class 2
MIEHEYKFLVDEPALWADRLIRIGFKATHPRALESTVMFDNPSGFMQETNGRVRLRSDGMSSRLSYKLPLEAIGGMKREVEHETGVESGAQAAAVLAGMGFEPVSSYERYRTSWRRGGVKADLDEFPFASYLELEGEPEDILAAAQEIELDPGQSTAEPCDTLFRLWREARGLSATTHMRFEDFDR